MRDRGGRSVAIVVLAALGALGGEACSSGGGGGGGGGGGAPIAPDDGPIDPDLAARAAVALNSCAGELAADSTLEQMYSRRRGTVEDNRAFARCIDAQRAGCAGVRACLGISIDLTGPCPRRCDGTVLESCDDEGKFRTDCAARGLSCVEKDGRAACIAPGAAACDRDGPTRSRCGADGVPLSCESVGLEARGPVCAALGLTCANGGCTGTEGACSGSGGPESSQIIYQGECVDGKLRACVGGQTTTFDCGKNIAGATCQPSGPNPRPGQGAGYCGIGTACQPGETPRGGCDGDSVVLCNGGRIDRVDCKSLGFSGCMQAGHAFCAPSPKADLLARRDGGL